MNAKEFRNVLLFMCNRWNESECSIKKAVTEGNIPKFRYDNYLTLVSTALSDSDEYKRK